MEKYNGNGIKRFKITHMIWQKRYFDPSSKVDIQEYKYFLDNSKWKDRCPFVLEWPHLTVPDMIRTRLIDTHIEVMLKNAK